MDTRTIIDYAMNDDAKAMRDALYASIHDRVNAHIQAQKQEVAQSIFPEEVEEFEEEVEMVYEANIEPTSAKSRTHIGNLSNPVVNSVVRSGKEIGLITKQPSGEYHAHHSAAKLAHAQSNTFDTKDKAHQFIRDAHAKAIKNGTLKSSFVQKEEYEEIDEASGNNEKKHLDSIIKMKEVKKSKHNMAPSIHDHMEDALEKGNHKKIDDLHKVFKHMSEEVEQIDELSLQTMKSAKEKLGSKALDAHYNDDKRSARNYAGRALHMGAKIKRKERSASSSVKEEVEELIEGKMDKMTLSALWHKHAQHQFGAENGYGGGEGGQHSHHAATAIENHVRKHYGNKVADDMLDHSDHHVARVEYAGRDEYEHHEKEGAKLRAKHKISGDLLGPDRN